jgi:hypothetical protein
MSINNSQSSYMSKGDTGSPSRPSVSHRATIKRSTKSRSSAASQSTRQKISRSGTDKIENISKNIKKIYDDRTNKYMATITDTLLNEDKAK